MANKFQLSEIPYAQFAQLGLDKQAVQTMLSMHDIENLLRGEKSNLKDFTLTFDNSAASKKRVELIVSAKFFLRRAADSSVELRIVEKNLSIENRFDVSEQTIKSLKMGESAVERDAKSNLIYTYQIDAATNGIMRIQQDKLVVPDVIQDVQLSQNQKEALRNGQTIELKKGEHKMDVKLDFNQRSMLKIEGVQQQNQAINVEKTNPIESKSRGMKRWIFIDFLKKWA